MKLALLATALLIGSNVVAVSGEKNLNFKLVTIYMGEKDGESHLTGVTVSPDGSLGTKDFYDKAGENGAETGHSVYYFANGTLVANYKGATTGTATGGHFKGTYEILSGTGEYQGATGTGAIDGAYGDASPLKNGKEGAAVARRRPFPRQRRATAASTPAYPRVDKLSAVHVRLETGSAKRLRAGEGAGGFHGPSESVGQRLNDTVSEHRRWLRIPCGSNDR